MFKLMGKEINAILGAQNILIWTYADPRITLQHQKASLNLPNSNFQGLFLDKYNHQFTGFHSAVGNEPDCRFRGCQFDPSP